MACNYCHEKGHMVKNREKTHVICPVLKDKLKKEAKCDALGKLF